MPRALAWPPALLQQNSSRDSMPRNDGYRLHELIRDSYRHPDTFRHSSFVVRQPEWPERTIPPITLELTLTAGNEPLLIVSSSQGLIRLPSQRA